MNKLNGIRVIHSKTTENSPTIQFPLPKTVKLPLSMSMGAPCSLLVKVGDEVTVGQKIGDSEAFFSSPIHASVSGKVTAITDYILANGNTTKAVEIESDGKQTPCKDIAPPKINNKEDFLKAVKESGICGLGGAGFPTHIKLSPKTPIDTLIINAAECEPYITSDYREMIEFPDDIIGGIQLVLKYLNIPKAKLAIEANKPTAIENLTKFTDKIDEIDIVTLKSTYPQGAEKVIIHSTTGRVVMEGQLPSDQGVIVINVTTIASIYRYCQTGMPLVSRRLTVEGDIVKQPNNIDVPIGTSIRSLLEFTDTEISMIKKLIAGGPMMGMCLYTPDTPVVKTSNAVLAFSNYEEAIESNCIRCGRCIRACPLNLQPTDLDKAFRTKNIDQLKKLRVNLCMNCGCCTYVCPANRKLAETNQLAKALVLPPRK